MEVRQLRLLRELGELGSVTAVAEALYLTPSAVSQQLRLLQDTVAVPLTRREGRTLRLTEAGKALAAAAAEVEVSLARARSTAEAFANHPGGVVSVSAFTSAATTFFPALLRASSGSGECELRLAEEDVEQAQFPVLTARYDLVIAHRLDYGPHWPAAVEVVPLLHEPLDVALPAQHPLAAKRQITLDDVGSQPWITVHDGYPLLSVVDAVAATAGHALDVVHRANDFAVAGSLVAAGAGVALMPRWTVRPPRGVVLRPLTGIRAHRRVDVLHRPEHGARRAVHRVLDRLAHQAARLSGS